MAVLTGQASLLAELLLIKKYNPDCFSSKMVVFLTLKVIKINSFHFVVEKFSVYSFSLKCQESGYIGIRLLY